jgi:hypothetical protein
MIRPYAWNKDYSFKKVKQRLLDQLKIPVNLDENFNHKTNRKRNSKTVDLPSLNI